MRRALATGLLALALLGAVVGLKWDVVHRFGSDLPMWDQWDAEGMTVFVPWSDGKLTLEHLLRPHNEHRVALSRLLALAQVRLTGQWDARVQCLLNAVLHGLVAVALLLGARREIGARGSAAAALLLAALFGLPLAWQNVISGFHSQQYFLLALSLGAIAWLPFSAPGSGRWWLGLGCAALALFSMASGLLAAASVIGLVALRAAAERALPRRRWPALLAAAVVVAAGTALLVRYDGHAGLKARTLDDFVAFTRHSLQWPAGHGAFALLLWGPLTLLGGLLVFRRTAGGRESDYPWMLVGLGAWTLAQIVASAWARGSEGGHPPSRYLDTLAFGLAVNGLALLWLLGRGRLGRALTTATAVLGLAWLGTAAVGVHRVARVSYTGDLPATRLYYENCERTVRAYLASGDAAGLRSGDIPYPDADDFRQRFDQPALRALLPASVRPPLRLETARGGAHLGEERAAGILRWTSRDRPPGTWEAVVVTFPRDTLLRFRGAAEGGLPSIRFVDTRLGRTVADVTAAARRRGGEFHASVTVPEGPARLVVTTGAGGWVSFEPPVVVAPSSAAGSALARSGWALFLASAALAGLVLAAEAIGRRGTALRDPAASPGIQP